MNFSPCSTFHATLSFFVLPKAHLLPFFPLSWCSMAMCVTNVHTGREKPINSLPHVEGSVEGCLRLTRKPPSSMTVHCAGIGVHHFLSMWSQHSVTSLRQFLAASKGSDHGCASGHCQKHSQTLVLKCYAPASMTPHVHHAFFLFLAALLHNACASAI